MPRDLRLRYNRKTRQKTQRVCNTHGMKFPTKLLLGKVLFSRSLMQSRAFSPRCQFHKHICVTFS